MATTQEKPSDHDLLIRLDEKFEGFLARYSVDMKSLNDGITLKLAEHQGKIEAHEKRLDEIQRIITVVSPEKTFDDYLVFKERVEKFFTVANAYRVAGGFVGGVIFFALTQIPNILKLWGVIK